MAKKIPGLRVVKGGIIGFLSFYAYQGFHHMQRPAPFDFEKLKDKPKTIVVIGSGMVGLTTAYYLSNHLNNKVIVLEKNEAPYLGTSKQNGNWMPINYTFNWLDIPFYPSIMNALKEDQS